MSSLCVCITQRFPKLSSSFPTLVWKSVMIHCWNLCVARECDSCFMVSAGSTQKNLALINTNWYKKSYLFLEYLRSITNKAKSHFGAFCIYLEKLPHSLSENRNPSSLLYWKDILLSNCAVHACYVRIDRLWVQQPVVGTSTRWWCANNIVTSRCYAPWST